MPRELIRAVRASVPEPPLPSVTETALNDAEVRLGFTLPDLLRELYLHVGNGRFGPGYGLLSLSDMGDRELSLVGSYLEMRRDYAVIPSWKWPTGLLAFCDWGCNIYACLDWTRVPNPVSTYEYVEESMERSNTGQPRVLAPRLARGDRCLRAGLRACPGIGSSHNQPVLETADGDQRPTTASILIGRLTRRCSGPACRRAADLGR